MKKISLIVSTNYINHYSLALAKRLNQYFDNFHLIISEIVPEDRKKLGFSEIDSDLIIKEYENKVLVQELFDNSDIVISDYNYKKYLKNRIRDNKITFVDSERFLKNDNVIGKLLRYAYYTYNYHNYKNERLLCISAYSAGDYNGVGLFKNRSYKWGYFPEPIKYKDIDNLISRKKKNSLLWAGRLLKWKHPEYAIEIANMLRNEGYKFKLNIIGNGEQENVLKKLIAEYKLEKYVFMLGSMSPDKVRKYMDESQIYLFTSDRGEGWGVVLNEAMNSSCACVSSYSAGSTPFMIKDGINGLIYKNDNLQDAYIKTKQLLDNSKLLNKICKNAYKTIQNEYNPDIAAKRFYKFCEMLINDENVDSLYEDGILSKAMPIE